MKTTNLIVLIIQMIFSFSAPIEDLVQLPDYPLNSTMYAGYLQVDPTDQFFYLFVESQSSPQDDPLIIWLNGGPGCSSLIGFSQEQGPAIFKFLQTNFTVNPYAWNKVSNIIYLESPSGVGYNIDTNQSFTGNDSTSANQNLNAVVEFFKKFPEFKKNKFFVAGESYGGVYVPYLAERIVKFNEKANPEDLINLEGILVGNGATDGFPQTKITSQFFVKRDLLPAKAIKEYKQCNDTLLCNNKALDNFYFDVLNNINLYDIYGDCAPAVDGFSCLDESGPTDYFNRDDVKKALRVPLNTVWNACGGANYLGGYSSIQNYPILIENNIRILIYSGDADSLVSTPYTRSWLRTLNLTAKDGENWRVWRDEDDEVLGGFLTEYEEGITFITVHGSGHMVPQYKPKLAFYFFRKFINNEKI